MNNNDENDDYFLPSDNYGEENGKKSPVVTIICVIVLLVLLGVGGFFAYKHFANDDVPPTEQDNPKEDVPKEDQGVEPPSDVQINEYDKIGGDLAIHCMKEGTTDYVTNVAVKKGDIVTCDYGIEVPVDFKIEKVFYQFDYGTSLNLLETKVLNVEATSKTEDKKVRDTFLEPNSIVESSYQYRFEVLDDTDATNLYFGMSNVVVKTSANEYYKFDNVKIGFKNSIDN